MSQSFGPQPRAYATHLAKQHILSQMKMPTLEIIKAENLAVTLKKLGPDSRIDGTDGRKLLSKIVNTPIHKNTANAAYSPPVRVHGIVL